MTTMSDLDLSTRCAALVRDVPDYPSPGVVFKDITPLLADGPLFAEVVRHIAAYARGRVDLVAGMEARGFILGAPVAVARPPAGSGDVETDVDGDDQHAVGVREVNRVRAEHASAVDRQTSRVAVEVGVGHALQDVHVDEASGGVDGSLHARSPFSG